MGDLGDGDPGELGADGAVPRRDLIRVAVRNLGVVDAVERFREIVSASTDAHCHHHHDGGAKDEEESCEEGKDLHDFFFVLAEGRKYWIFFFFFFFFDVNVKSGIWDVFLI